MDTGIIVRAARRDARHLVTASAALVIVLVAVLAVNWQHLYNWVEGPFFVLIAAPLFPLSLMLLGYGFWAAGRLERHTAFAALKHLGPASDLAFRIERELIAVGRGARVGPFFVTASWIVTIDPVLRLFPIDELMGFGHEMIVKKSGAKTVERHVLRVWVRGRPLYETIEVTEPDVRGVLAGIANRCPWAVVDDIAAFERRWRSARQEHKRVVDKARRAGPAAVAQRAG